MKFPHTASAWERLKCSWRELMRVRRIGKAIDLLDKAGIQNHKIYLLLLEEMEPK